MKPWTPLTIVLLAACSGPGKTPTTTPAAPPDAEPTPPPVAPVFEAAALLTGTWTAAEFNTMVTWMRPGRPDGALYGVAVSDPPVVWVVDDEPVDVSADQRWLRLTVYEPGAPAPLRCDQDRDQPEGLWFTCTDEEITTLRFVQNGEMLDYERSTDDAGPFTFHHNPAESVRAPDAEAADREFDAATEARGADGWAAWFADDGVQWDDDVPVIGPEAIRAYMKPVLEGGKLRWKPTTSRLEPEGTLAATAGTWTFEPPGIGGTFVTVWRKDPEGWRVIFDVGRPDVD